MKSLDLNHYFFSKNIYPFLDPTSLPFSFQYGARSSDELLRGWKQGVKTTKTPAGEQLITTWVDSLSGLVVEWTLLVYKDYSAIEMHLAFEQRGSRSAQVLRNVHVVRHQTNSLPLEVIYETGGMGPWLLDPELRKKVPANFKPSVTRLASAGEHIKLFTLDGWPSNWHLPFWLLLGEDGQGLYYSLGWEGQWVANLSVDTDKMLKIEAGMEHLNLRLKPGERISQPSVLIGQFSGGRWAGHNALRKILYEQYVPLLGGKKPLAPVWWGHGCITSNDYNEETLRPFVDSVAPLGVEYFLLDNSWPNVDFWDVGDWRPNPSKFPQGLEPIAEYISSKGMAVGMWFDPERVTDAAYEAFEHKEWLIPACKEPAFEMGRKIKVWLLDLSRPEVREWMIDLIGHYVRTLNLGYLRWDMNYPPLEMWLNAHEKEPERLGMMEIRYVEGLYEVLDAIRENHPQLLIEWDAGGGRRIDLESVRRSHTQWTSDIIGDVEKTRPHLTGANLFLPGNCLTSKLIGSDSRYDYYCQFGGALGFGFDFRGATSAKISEAIELVSRYKELRGYLVQDYYPLFDPLDPRGWDGWQFHDAKKDEGFFLVFRPASSPYLEAMIKLHGLDPTKPYVLKPDCKTNLPESASGKMLGEGSPVRIAPRQALLVQYH